jgi:hypothetical protein
MVAIAAHVVGAQRVDADQNNVGLAQGAVLSYPLD